MDVDEDSDLFYKTQSHMDICNKYQLKKATYHVINHSYFEIQMRTYQKGTGAMFYCFQRAPGIALKDGCIVVYIKMGLGAKKPDFDAWEQQERRPVFVSVQSDQRLYCKLIVKCNI